MTEKGKVFIVSGPSGSGKSTVLREVFSRRDHIWFSVSATTRAPRPGEEEGVDYLVLFPTTFKWKKSEWTMTAGYNEGTGCLEYVDGVSGSDAVVAGVPVQVSRARKKAFLDALNDYINEVSK